jgi:hypothetical protein
MSFIPVVRPDINIADVAVRLYAAPSQENNPYNIEFFSKFKYTDGFMSDSSSSTAKFSSPFSGAAFAYAIRANIGHFILN